ncbi:MAG: PEP-CTERM sorting domain-containing protein [Acidobacteriaceae bacterium]|nr:PEP-CTERM sorting domain-containing protein [Acidobacteriaceae bacterium]MBV9297131.1 PEP-CTERM sorting domain-containing protein [Acidobacteriaceae bacterium]
MLASARQAVRFVFASAVICFGFSPRPATAGTISFTLSATKLTGSPGSTVTFDGSVTNDSGGLLNASDFFFNFFGFDPTSVAPIQDLGISKDFPIPNGTTSAVVPLFDVAISGSPSGSNFPIQVQLEDINSDLSLTQTVTVSLSGASVPEPATIFLAAIGISVIILGLRRRFTLRRTSPVRAHP